MGVFHPTVRARSLSPRMGQGIRSSHEIVDSFHGMIGGKSYPASEQARTFFQTICDYGLCRSYSSGRPSVAVLGFGEEFDLIRSLLQLGYSITAIEDFDATRPSPCRPPITRELVRDALANYAVEDQLAIVDWRDLDEAYGSMDVVLASAIIDDAFETVARLPLVGGIIAATDLGYLGSQRVNFLVDMPETFIYHAANQLALGFKALCKELIMAPSVLPSHFVNLTGHSAYVVQRTS